MGIYGKIRKHYEEYPEDPNNFEDWVEKAQNIWEPVEKMKYSLE